MDPFLCSRAFLAPCFPVFLFASSLWGVKTLNTFHFLIKSNSPWLHWISIPRTQQMDCLCPSKAPLMYSAKPHRPPESQPHPISLLHLLLQGEGAVKRFSPSAVWIIPSSHPSSPWKRQKLLHSVVVLNNIPPTPSLHCTSMHWTAASTSHWSFPSLISKTFRESFSLRRYKYA